MKLIRCLNCNKVLGEVDGKAKIKCKMAGCHCMNVIDTDAGTHLIEAMMEPKEWKTIYGSCPTDDPILKEIERIHENVTKEHAIEWLELIKTGRADVHPHLFKILTNKAK